MIAEPCLTDLLQHNQKLEKIILDNGAMVSYELFSEWRSNQAKMGEYLADEALGFIAKKYDAYIIANPVNPSSYAHFIRSDVQSKAPSIRGQTLRSGIRNGFLALETFEHSLKPLCFWIQGQQRYAVIREDQECLVKEATASDTILNVSCYEDSAYIVSDIDLVSIFLRDNSDETLLDSTYGELTAQELMLIQDVNNYFQQLVSQYCSFSGSTEYRLIAHGPANRFSHSKSSHLHCPMKVHAPSTSIERLCNEKMLYSTLQFLDFNRELGSLGYHAYLNPQWEI